MISSRIIDVCEHKNLTVKAFAEELGMSQQSLQRYTSGKSKPGYEFFVAMYNHGINLHWLVSGKGSMYRSEDTDNLPPTDDPELKFLRSLFSVASPGLQKFMKPLVDEVERQEQQKKNNSNTL